MRNEVMKIDVSIGLSLLDKEETLKIKDKMDKIHPIIPNAKMTGSTDKGVLHF